MLLLIALAGCGGDEPAAEATEAAEQVTVLGAQDVATAARGTINQGIVVTGSLEPHLRVDVKAQVPGTLARLTAQRGERVRQGEVLAVIEAEGIRGQAASAQAAVAAARSARALAERQLESARTLHEAGALSDLEFEQAKTAYESAEAQLAAAQGQATSAAEQAARATVRAPITGVVSDRLVEIGEAVNPAQPLYTVVNTDVLELEGQVPVSQAAALEVGQEVVFTIDGYPGRTFRGAVARIEPTADPQTRQLGVYLRLENPGNLVGGLFATGRVLSETAEDALLVPRQAVRGSDNAPYVLAVEEGQIVRRNVTVTARDPERGFVAVAGDVQAGTVVLVATTTDIAEGTRVRLAAQPSQTAHPESAEE